MFPNIPIEQIQNDLRQTNSTELTIENILENRLNSVQEVENDDVTYEIIDDESSEDDRNSDNQTDEERTNNFIRQRHNHILK